MRDVVLIVDALSCFVDVSADDNSNDCLYLMCVLPPPPPPPPSYMLTSASLVHHGMSLKLVSF